MNGLDFLRTVQAHYLATDGSVTCYTLPYLGSEEKPEMIPGIIIVHDGVQRALYDPTQWAAVHPEDQGNFTVNGIAFMLTDRNYSWGRDSYPYFRERLINASDGSQLPEQPSFRESAWIRADE
jgi:hypothetical protein